MRAKALYDEVEFIFFEKNGIAYFNGHQSPLHIVKYKISRNELAMGTKYHSSSTQDHFRYCIYSKLVLLKFLVFSSGRAMVSDSSLCAPTKYLLSTLLVYVCSLLYVLYVSQYYEMSRILLLYEMFFL